VDTFFDFYGEGEKEFYNKFEGVETVLIQGKHWEKPPLVTILLPTYKRCKLLKEALESALNQVGFDNYQIIVVDNEGEDVDVITDTAKLVSKYDDDKIIYYRHRKSVSFKMDNAAKLAKSKWIVFLHDDDILSPHHLKTLTTIAGRNPMAKYISCPCEEFIDGKDYESAVCGGNYEYELYTNKREMVCSGYYPGWLGALINREAYIETGGMPSYSNGMGDFCMVQKFHYMFGIWELKSMFPLYLRRIWKGQATSDGSEVWAKLYMEEYKYTKYVSRVCHSLTYKYWDRISSYRILEKARNMNTGVYNCNIDLVGLAEQAHMSKNSLCGNFIYKIDMFLLRVYNAIVRRLFIHKRDEGKILL
jgi:glycosyltransferase involved in cell wall biosynthesis